MAVGAYGASCAAGDVVLTIRDWTDTQGSTVVAANATLNITAASCYACDSTGNTAGGCGTSDAVNTGKGVANYNSGTPVTFTMKQNVDFTAMYLEISSVRFEPLTTGAQGRFSFKPKLNNAFETYAAQSVFEYTFVSMAFAADSVCQVWSGDYSGASHSTKVSSCDVNTATVKVTLAEASENFVVSVLGSTVWASNDSNVTGDYKLFGTSVLSHNSALINNTCNYPYGSGVATTANTPAANTTVTFNRSMTNVMDEGAISLTFDFAVLESWDKDGRAVVEVPKYYRPDLGDGLRCTLNDAAGVLLEELYCEMQWDWSLVVWGPRSNTLVKTASPD